MLLLLNPLALLRLLSVYINSANTFLLLFVLVKFYSYNPVSVSRKSDVITFWIYNCFPFALISSLLIFVGNLLLDWIYEEFLFFDVGYFYKGIESFIKLLFNFSLYKPFFFSVEAKVYLPLILPYLIPL